MEQNTEPKRFSDRLSNNEHGNEPFDDPGELSGTGYLIVQVTTARGAIPLGGARVDIRSYEPEKDSAPETRGDVIRSLVSDRSGNTTRISLPAPPRSISEKPGRGRPYALYQAEVALEGYYGQTYSGIPVFDGITAIQPAVLIPLPENGAPELPRPDEIRYFEGIPGDL